MRPHSRGYVHIADADDSAAPLIDPNYLASEFDRQCMRDGVRLAQTIGATPPLSDYSAGRISPETLLDDDDAIDAWVRQSANTIFHPVGTCRMGPEPDSDAVVDDRLRVHGLDGLRVVDASVMPRLPAANTNAPTIMIAEKAADLIRQNA